MRAPDLDPSSPAPDPGSFRDWDSRVFRVDGRVLRALTADGLAGWRALAGSRLFARGGRRGKARRDRGGRRAAAGLDPAAVLEHERIPFVSYPYEWPFSMLRDAALLQLELLRRALDEDLTLKDATPYDVQWRGTAPVFIDVGSFEALRPNEPWEGYRRALAERFEIDRTEVLAGGTRVLYAAAPR